MLKNLVDNRLMCRVCSGRGEHEISFPIPFYLHETPKEVIQWRKPIRELLEEILNVPVRPNDGLPQRMCTVCISYMKHAITFRNQALTCRLRLLPAALICHKDGHSEDLVGKPLGFNTSTPLSLKDRNDNSKMDLKVNKLQHKAKFPESSETIPKITHVGGDAKGFFSYHQKPFVEDDVTEMPFFDGHSFMANPPEKLSQRTCTFCGMRFMFEETYDEHTAICIHRRFAIFIHQCNQVHQMKLERTITPHEFIRRMVFLLQTNQDILDKLHACEKKIPQLMSTNDDQGIQSPGYGVQDEEKIDFPDETAFHVNEEMCPSEESSPEPPNKTAMEPKKVLCPNCGIGFLTISHLDRHRIRCQKQY